jgi:hypothetical protein
MNIRNLLLALSALLPVPLFAQVAQPGAEHQKLTTRAGTWNAVIEAQSPDGKASRSKGVSTRTVACAGLWVIDDFHADFEGQKFHGHGITGYDPAKGKYVGTWVDSMTAMLMTMEGSYDREGKVLTMTGMAPGMDGKPVLHRFVTTHQDANTDVFEMFMPGADGKDIKLMTITYTRVPAQTEKAPPK